MLLSLKRFLPHLLVLLGFIVLSLAYFSPVLQGKKIYQSDIMHHDGMAQQQRAFKAETGEDTYWTNSGFGGMPTFVLGARYPHDYIKALDETIRFLPRPADYLFLYFIGFYILLLSLKVDFKLAALGALAFGFSTYLIIILGVGHNSKAHAIAYMPLVLSGIILTFRKKYVFGFLLTILALGLEIVANHPQMTYYLLLLVIVLGIAYLVDAFKKKQLPHFFKSVGLLVIAAIIAVGLNATSLLAIKEYSKESTRGKSDLTINADGSPKINTNGLDPAYITEYSYGVLESFNLFIPKFMGGGSRENVGKDSELYNAYINLGASPIDAIEASRNAPTYWGDQTIVEAPAYIGAVIIFLFVLGLFLVKGRLKWWLVGGALLSLLLSYGKNFSLLTDFFIEYVPLYDKFRAVSSIQVILELCIPVIGIFALVRLFNDFEKRDEKLKALKYATGIVGGLTLIFLLFHSVLLDFSGGNDYRFADAYGKPFVEALIEDRKDLFVSDTIRTLILVLLAAGTMFYFLKEKLSEKLVVVVFAGLILFDLISVDRQYVNSDNFVAARQVDKPYLPTAADNKISKDNGHFRVLDVSREGQSKPARAAYFHNSLSGYHAAKMNRFEALMDFHIYKNNSEVLNMLNTKYILTENQQGGVEASTKFTQPNGNAWFVTEVKTVNSGNEEILALDSLDTKNKTVVLKSIASEFNLKSRYKRDSLASIKLLAHKPNALKYESNNTNEGLAVFSELYYYKGWNVYIDGKLTPHLRVNYALRALPVPKGQHVIEFKFEPQVVKTGSKIALGSSVLFLTLLILGGFYQLKRKD